jgi:hypothetical protein
MTEPSMVEHSDQTATLPPAGPPAPPAAPVQMPAAPRARRTLGLPVVGAIAAGALVIGGLVGGIIGYAVHSDGPDFGGRPGMGPGMRFQQGGPGQQGNLPQPPNGQAPGQSQQQDGGGSDD